MKAFITVSVTFFGLVVLTPCVVNAANVAAFQKALTLKNQISLENHFTDSVISDVNGFLVNGLIPPYLGRILSGIEQGDRTALKNELLVNISSQCGNHISAWVEALFTNITLPKNFWALQMVDAWGKLPEGILSGHTSALGDFEECLAVRGKTEGLTGQSVDNFKGKYCTTMLIPNFPVLNEAGISVSKSNPQLPDDSFGINAFGDTPPTLLSLLLLIPKLGICYPSSCSNEDVGQLLTNAFHQIPELDKYILPIVSYCTTDDRPKLNNGDIAMWSILSVILAVCVLGTAIDLALGPHSSKRNGYSTQALLAFSVYTNTKKFLNTKSSGGENFGCMHGIRFLSTCWVVLAHQFGQMATITWNTVEIGRLYQSNWTIYSIFNGTVSVDTFFTMSGLLFAYNMLKVLNKSKGAISIPMMYLHRYLRLTPTYALLVGLVATFYANLGNGPLWLPINQAAASCRKNWWHNLLYINNLIKYNPDDPASGMCHGETWYLANDMQFFLLSPLLIYPLFKWETIGMIALAAVSIASIATPWIIHNKENLVPTVLVFSDVGEYFDLSYIKPWMRFGPYVVGLWAGFLLYKTANKKLKLSRLVVLAGWLLSTAMALSIIFGIIPWFDPNNEVPKGLAGFYAGTHRFAWGVVICWIIFACTKGYGGPVNTFLSWKPFIPLGRLSFCVYLISYSLQQMFAARQLQATTFDVYTTTILFFAHLVMSLLVAFIFCITMESPFIALEKFVFQGPGQVSTPTQLSDTNGKTKV